MDAAHNSLLAHVSAMVLVALEAAASRAPTAPEESVALRVAVIEALRARDADAAEKAMQMLVDLAWEAIDKSDQDRTP